MASGNQKRIQSVGSQGEHHIERARFPNRPAKTQCPSQACIRAFKVRDVGDGLPEHDVPDGQSGCVDNGGFGLPTPVLAGSTEIVWMSSQKGIVLGRMHGTDQSIPNHPYCGPNVRFCQTLGSSESTGVAILSKINWQSFIRGYNRYTKGPLFTISSVNCPDHPGFTDGAV